MKFSKNSFRKLQNLFQIGITITILYYVYFWEKIPENDYNVDVIERLLSGGAKLDARTAWGDTAVHYAGNCV